MEKKGFKKLDLGPSEVIGRPIVTVLRPHKSVRAIWNVTGSVSREFWLNWPFITWMRGTRWGG